MVDTNIEYPNTNEQADSVWPQSIGQLMKLVPDAIIMIDVQQRIIRFNDGAEVMFGYKRNEIYRQPLALLIPERYQTHHDQYVEDYMHGDNRSTRAMDRGDLYALRKDGSEFPIEATISSLSTPEGKVAIVIVREISVRKEQEAAILERNAELDAFAHTVAHDLKAPMHHMLGFSTLLYDEIQAIENEQFQHLKKYVQYIQRAAVKAGNIINELLLLASIRQEDVQLQVLDMDLIVKEALKRLELEIDAARATIHLPAIWPQALGHPAWIEEIWTNYLSNGVKYSGTPPMLTLSATKLNDGFVRFMVADNGNGVPSEKHDLLFAPFTRLDRVRAEGHGLGLSIVRRIADKVGGRVGLLNQKNNGACFYFDLPAANSNSNNQQQ